MSISLSKLVNYKFLGHGEEWANCYINFLLLNANETNNYFIWAYKNRRATVDYNFVLGSNLDNLSDEVSWIFRYVSMITPIVRFCFLECSNINKGHFQEGGILISGFTHEYEGGKKRMIKAINIWQRESGKHNYST